MGAAHQGTARLRRSDAQRNAEAILAAAADVLATRPQASLQEIAAAAGVHRATLHRHFAAREDLIRALRGRVLDELVTLLDAALQAPTPREAVVQATRDTLALGDRYRMWRVAPSYDDLSEARRDELGTPLKAMFAAAQAEGDVRSDLPAEALAVAWGGLIVAALPVLAEERMTHEQATAFVLRMLTPKA